MGGSYGKASSQGLSSLIVTSPKNLMWLLTRRYCQVAGVSVVLICFEFLKARTRKIDTGLELRVQWHYEKSVCDFFPFLKKGSNTPAGGIAAQAPKLNTTKCA